MDKAQDEFSEWASERSVRRECSTPRRPCVERKGNRKGKRFEHEAGTRYVKRAEQSWRFSSTVPIVVSCFCFALPALKTGLRSIGTLIVGNLEMTLLEFNFHINSF